MIKIIYLFSTLNHATTSKRGGDAIFRHEKLRDILVESVHNAHLSVQVEAGTQAQHRPLPVKTGRYYCTGL